MSRLAEQPTTAELMRAVLYSPNAVFGVPPKAEIFKRTAESRQDEFLLLTTVFVASSGPIEEAKITSEVHDSRMVEHSCRVHVSLMTRPLDLTHIAIASGRLEDDGPYTFVGIAHPGSFGEGRREYVQITVDKTGWATYQVMVRAVVLASRSQFPPH